MRSVKWGQTLSSPTAVSCSGLRWRETLGSSFASRPLEPQRGALTCMRACGLYRNAKGVYVVASA
jgi:hypothetical protein